jgi:hypothetical protein
MCGEPCCNDFDRSQISESARDTQHSDFVVYGQAVTGFDFDDGDAVCQKPVKAH